MIKGTDKMLGKSPEPVTLKVLIHAPRLDIAGGKQGLFQALTPHFKHSVTFFTYGSRGRKEGKSQQYWRLLKDYWLFMKALKKGGYEVIHLNPSMSRKPFFRDMIFMYLARRANKPTIAFWHGWDWDFFEKVRSKHMRLFRGTYGKAGAMIVLSSEMEKAIRKIAPTVKAYRKTTSPDLGLQEGLDETQIAKRYSEGRSLRLLFLARLEREKGVFECLSAFETLKPEYPDLRLCIAGDGAAAESVRQYIEEKKLGDIELLGFVSGPEKKAAYLESDIYLFPSYYPEGLPVSLLEAMSCGLPVITTDVGGIKDEFKEGKMGFVVPPRDGSELSRRLKVLLDNRSLMSEFALFNYRHVAENYAAPIVAEELDALYKEVAGDRPGGRVQKVKR